MEIRLYPPIQRGGQACEQKGHGIGPSIEAGRPHASIDPTIVDLMGKGDIEPASSAPFNELTEAFGQRSPRMEHAACDGADQRPKRLIGVRRPGAGTRLQRL
jgi:hypothetical protein